MDKSVILTIQGRQFVPEDNAENTIELITPGHLSRVGSDYLITYQESELTGLSGTTTTLRVGNGRVSLSRVGAVSSHMVFEKGRRHLSYYDMSEGALTVGVNASKVSTKLSDTGGRIEVDYFIDIDEQFGGENMISVSVAVPQTQS